MDDAATGIGPFVSLCACLDSASAGISVPVMWISVSSMTDNLNNKASAVVFSLLDAFTIGM